MGSFYSSFEHFLMPQSYATMRYVYKNQERIEFLSAGFTYCVAYSHGSVDIHIY